MYTEGDRVFVDTGEAGAIQLVHAKSDWPYLVLLDSGKAELFRAQSVELEDEGADEDALELFMRGDH